MCDSAYAANHTHWGRPLDDWRPSTGARDLRSDLDASKLEALALTSDVWMLVSQLGDGDQASTPQVKDHKLSPRDRTHVMEPRFPQERNALGWSVNNRPLFIF